VRHADFTDPAPGTIPVAVDDGVIPPRLTACDQCARAIWQVRSTHRTSAGAVGYARCPCEAWLVRTLSRQGVRLSLTRRGDRRQYSESWPSMQSLFAQDAVAANGIRPRSPMPRRRRSVSDPRRHDVAQVPTQRYSSNSDLPPAAEDPTWTEKEPGAASTATALQAG
jgi:hypothetical protein